MNKETINIIDRYEKRKNSIEVRLNLSSFYYNHYAISERELKYKEIIKSRFEEIDKLKILEIGAGTGVNLFLFKKLGILWKNINANELLFDRINFLKKNFPGIKILEGDACEIENLNNSFDIVFQSVVFSSILNFEFKENLANKMWSLLKSGGIILWYDFAFNNPKNKDVKGIKKAEIKKLFSESKKITFYKTTLAPPIGRRVKNFYPYLNFPFLRSHLIAVIEK